MSKSHVLTLRVPWELKQRLEKEAKVQGVSINQLSNYLINEQLTQIEMISALEIRLSNKSISKLKSSVNHILKKIPSKTVPNWDSIQ